MKKLPLIFAVLALSLGGAEVSFRVADVSDSKNDERLMLLAFDAFSEVARAKPGCEVFVDAAERIITFRCSYPIPEGELAEALTAAFVGKQQKQLAQEVEALRIRVASVRAELEREASPTRRTLLQRVYASMLPALDGERPPFPLRRVKKEAIQLPQPTGASAPVAER